MYFDKDMVGAVARHLRDSQPVAATLLNQVKSGKSITREAALIVGKLIIARPEMFDCFSVADTLGYVELCKDLQAHRDELTAESEYQANKKAAELVQKLAAKKQKEDDKARAKEAKLRREEEKFLRIKEKEDAQRKQNEARQNKLQFTVKGTGVDDITTIIPEVCKWLAKHPSVYVSGGMLSRWRDSVDGMEQLNNDNFGALLGMGFTFRNTRMTPEGEVFEYLAQCPLDIRTSILGTRYFHCVREVTGVLNRPVVMGDGSIIGVQKGHDADTQLLFTSDADLVQVEIDQAYRDLHNVLHEFPESAIPGAFALIFTELMRPCLPTAPMMFVDAPALGSGKSLLAKVCLSIINSQQVTPITQPKREDEFEKTVQSQLVKYPGQALFLDDFAGFIDYQFLKTLLTSDCGVEFRVLGTNKSYKAKGNFTLVMSGNNATLGEEIERRTVKIKVDTGMEFPAKRQTKRNPDQLKAHINNNRAYLRSCAVTILTDALNKAEERHSTRSMGSFETWAETVGKSVVYATEKLKELGLVDGNLNGDVTPGDSTSNSQFDCTAEVFAKIYQDKDSSEWRLNDLSGVTAERVNDLLGTNGSQYTNNMRGLRLVKYSGRPREHGGATYLLERCAQGKWRITLTAGSVHVSAPNNVRDISL